MHYSSHTLLAGEGATNFSLMMGLEEQDLHSEESVYSFGNWSQVQHCQPNFFLNVEAQNTSCPPYRPLPTPSYSPAPAAAPAAGRRRPVPASERDHDTVGLCALDLSGSLAVGVSSNGANHKIAGRIGDAPIVGAGGYASNGAGCAAATGDGDITMRFLPAYQAVENMRRGMTPADACDDAVRRIEKYYPAFELGLVCLSADGDIGGESGAEGPKAPLLLLAARHAGGSVHPPLGVSRLSPYPHSLSPRLTTLPWLRHVTPPTPTAASHGWTFTYCAASPLTGGPAPCTRVPPMDSAAGVAARAARNGHAPGLLSSARRALAGVLESALELLRRA